MQELVAALVVLAALGVGVAIGKLVSKKGGER